MMRRSEGSTFLVLFVAAALGCSKPAARTEPSASVSEVAWPDAAAGVASAELAAVVREHWLQTMEASPEWASSLGDPRGAHLVSDPSVGAAEAARQRLLAVQEGLIAIPPASLNDSDAQVREVLLGVVRDGIAEAPCSFETWAVSPRSNPLVALGYALSTQPLDDPMAEAAALARVEAAAVAVPEHLRALQTGLIEGRVASVGTLRRVVEQVQAELARPTERWAVVQTLRERGGDPLGDAAATQVRDHLRPAIEAYAAFLADTLLPAARSDTAPGLASLPEGDACYQARIQHFTTLPLTADEVHTRGHQALALVHDEMSRVGARALGTSDVAAIFERLRDDPSLRFTDEDAIVTAARTALARAEDALPGVLGRLPQTACEVRVIPEVEAPYTTIAYYRPPAPGGRPGAYFVNTYDPTSRARYEAEALAFHESVPGHHTQIALAMEQGEAPAFMRFGGATAFVEGWALYAERLADELGLYTDDLSRLGMLSFEAWRASRLVVDTGLHAKGWSRDEAEAFMLDNTALAPENVRNEVDRYIAWPGQALAYKIGQEFLIALRQEAEDALGDAFELAHFHDVVLGAGALPLPVVAARVRAWVAAGGAAPTP